MECYTYCKVHESSVNVVIEFFQLQHFTNVSHRDIEQDKRLTYKVKTNAESIYMYNNYYDYIVILYYYIITQQNVIDQ